MSTATGFVCVLTSDLLVGDGFDPCLNCGGSATLGGTQWAVVTDLGRFCSEDCAAEAEEFAARARKAAATDWCAECGFDRHEHAPDCPRARA